MAIVNPRSPLTRRNFLGRSAVLAGGTLLTFTALERLSARSAAAQAGKNPKAHGYGPLAPQAPDNDPGGFEILALPKEFSYVAFSAIGDVMSDDNPVAVNLDGTAAFRHPHERHVVRLIRNHEVRTAPGTVDGAVLGPTESKYDIQGVGGTTTLDYNERSHEFLQHFVSLNGTIVNCAGGIGLAHRSWITCEETTASAGAGGGPGWAKNHGYCFQVPVNLPDNTTAEAVPITDMGRFSHEALAVDQRTGIVYHTEDPGSGVGAGFYRYLPFDPWNLYAGGRLQMLGIEGLPQYDAREHQQLDRWLPVTWYDVAEPDPADASNASPLRTFAQAFDQGAALFNRLEGCWYDGGSIFFDSTSGGDAKNGDVNSDGFAEGYGQIWEYRPERRGGGKLRLIFESTGADELDSPDNLVVTPRGGLILCEDDAGSNDGDSHPLAPGITDVNRLIGLAPQGEAFEFAVNRLNDSELAGACFSPSGRTLFVNIFGTGTAGSGMTLAIRGPWSAGPL
jgi:secreted PhoX family phosphatase